MYGFAVLIYVFVGLLLIAVAVPLIRGRVRRNLLYGFRTPKTLSDDSIWFPANEYAGRKFLKAGVITSAAAVVLDLIPGLTTPGYLLWCAGVMLAAILWSTISSLLYLRRL
jgi:uncharacterized membrane protein